MRRLFVVGTAGHIDHGKSALVKTLTGIDPDRLEEEKRRGMTIDLGFAHFDLPSGKRVGIVDVPGHERLIKNMLAGATGIDLVLLVIAADEGVMPQTREHLDILRFLPVRQGIVVLNKIDLIEDPSWLSLVRDDVNALVAGTFLHGAPMVELSARTGQGIPTLVETMDRMLDHLPPPQIDGPARLPIDRAFTMGGFGTVVTGTLWTGRIALGETLELLPMGKTVRVRGVQSHGQAVNAGIAGSRVAVNLVGVEKDEVGRGNVLCTLGAFRPTDLIDVGIHLLQASPVLNHLARIRFYIGSEEAIGRLILLDRPRFEPGSSSTAQIRLEKPIVAASGDPFVIRRYSPVITVGGGEIINAHPPRRRRDAASVAEIEQSSAAGMPRRLEVAIQDAGRMGTTIEELQEQLSISRTQLDAFIPELVNSGRLIVIGGRLFHRATAEALAAAIVREVDARHAAEPWRVGISKEEVKVKSFDTGDNRLYAHVMAALVAAGKVDETGEFVRRPGFTPTVDPKLAGARDRILRMLLDGRFVPPGLDEIAKQEDRVTFDRVFRALRDEGLVVEAGSGVFFHRDVLVEIKRIVVTEIGTQGSITVATLRDKLSTSRKYALSVLEYFDSIKLTRRVGDARVLAARASTSERA